MYKILIEMKYGNERHEISEYFIHLYLFIMMSTVKQFCEEVYVVSYINFKYEL